MNCCECGDFINTKGSVILQMCQRCYTISRSTWWPWESWEEKKDYYYYNSNNKSERQCFFDSKEIAFPDRIVHQFVFCEGAREENGWPYPFPGQLSSLWQGVYLLFVETGRPFRLLPLYAGQTKRMGHRLQIHHSDTAKMDYFFNLLNTDANIEPVLWSACWWIKEKYSRVSMEHKLIGQLAPILNKN